MIDAHVHIERGPYTIDWINEFIFQALKMGVTELYLLEHTHRFNKFEKYYDEVIKYNHYQKDWLARRNGLSFDSYLELVKKYENKIINVKWGLEVCYLPGIEREIEILKKDDILDFYTGSVHWINGWGFDHKKKFWLDKEVDNEYKKYFDQEKELIKSGVFDHLAHPDSIKCFNNYPSYNLDETYDELVSLAKTTGIKFEQSCGLYNNYGHDTIGLEPKYLSKIKENNVTILTASDAHQPRDIGKNLNMALKIINNA